MTAHRLRSTVRKPLHEPGTELSVVTRAMAASAKQTFELVSQLHQAVMLASTNFTITIAVRRTGPNN
jgi:hypothetical protein